ncbi:3-demethylubiquinone-9 3-methyltransferase [Microbacterium azadirachtae]|uniref:3-demethylubiquinone-9 3-methyltransferase n=1 Tax=Microbacterium azadirachtae TaxID=582680 RepID=A0A0F0KPF5_9MICO|nr:VOC family protein [Microbacterium azadirachtae]KJL22743.1 3-demethylubiquinone-9 3-methyltransferase [Microbacterium azadirachtae]
MTQRIIPNIWCAGDAEEAGAFYASVFERASAQVVARYPEEGLSARQSAFAGQALTVDVSIGGYRLTLINAGDEFSPTSAISFVVCVDPRDFGGDEGAARAWINRAWTALGEDGRVLMDIGEYFFSGLYGWVEDRYGVSWQLKLMDPGAAPEPAIIPMLVFGGPLQRKAEEAVALYGELLPPSGIVRQVTYPVTEPPHVDVPITYTEFLLAGQLFASFDSPIDRDHPFTPGVSLQIDCSGQEEIDRIWSALSAVPEAEQCGWLVDRFGVSWQVVPAELGELMQRPDAYAHLMRMKKIVIADL